MTISSLSPPTHRDVECREVGLRDGLQILKTFMPTEAKLAWVEAEVAAGMPELQVCSFVPPKLIPQFADAGEVARGSLELAAAGPATISALVPNLRGAEAAFAAGVHKIDIPTSVSEAHNQSNLRRSKAESVAEVRRIAAARDAAAEAGGQRCEITASLSTALGCTIAGRVAPNDAVALAEELLDAGADEITVADTVGYANPTEVRTLFRDVLAAVGDRVPVAAHFHDTRGLGLANVYAALDAGVRRFDASLAGLGGCPYAPFATGNIVMEDLVFLLEGAGLATGVNLDALVEIRELLARHLPDEPLHGMYAKAGAPKGFTFASSSSSQSASSATAA